MVNLSMFLSEQLLTTAIPTLGCKTDFFGQQVYSYACSHCLQVTPETVSAPKGNRQKTPGLPGWEQ